MKLSGLILIILLFAGCTGSSDTMTVVETMQPSTDKIPFEAPSSKSLSVLEFYHTLSSGVQDSYTINGDVGEVMHTDRYTYMKLVEGEEELWVATSRAEITEGVNVIVTGSTNFDFYSSSFNKTFNVLILAPTYNIVKDGEVIGGTVGVPSMGMGTH